MKFFFIFLESLISAICTIIFVYALFELFFVFTNFKETGSLEFPYMPVIIIAVYLLVRAIIKSFDTIIETNVQTTLNNISYCIEELRNSIHDIADNTETNLSQIESKIFNIDENISNLEDELSSLHEFVKKRDD